MILEHEQSMFKMVNQELRMLQCPSAIFDLVIISRNSTGIQLWNEKFY